MSIPDRIAGMQAEVAAWRRDIHAHPEILFDVLRTAGSVAEKLKAFGCDEVVTGIGKTGGVGVIRGKGAKGRKVGGVGAGMDAEAGWGIGRRGWSGAIRGRGTRGRRVVGRRAEMAAPPRKEEPTLPYRSTN